MSYNSQLATIKFNVDSIISLFYPNLLPSGLDKQDNDALIVKESDMKIALLRLEESKRG